MIPPAVDIRNYVFDRAGRDMWSVKRAGPRSFEATAIVAQSARCELYIMYVYQRVAQNSTTTLTPLCV